MTKEYEPQTPVTYIYTLSINATGAIDSDAPEDVTRDLLIEALNDKYSGNVDLMEFRPATADELSALEAYYDLDVDTTIN